MQIVSYVNQKRKAWKNIQKITERFPITRIAEETKTLWQQLAVDGEIREHLVIMMHEKGLQMTL